MDPSESFSEKFFAYLQKRGEADTSVIATLRRSLMLEPGTDIRSFPLVETWTSGMNDRRRRTIIYLAAGLWSQVVRQGRGSPLLFPKAMRQCQQQDRSDSIEKRFTALLDADVDDELHWRLRSALTLVASKHIALDWPHLLDDLLKWHYRDRPVQARWAQAFWGQAPEATA